MKFFIVARNTAQAREWIRNKRATDLVWDLNHPNSDIIILNNPSQARGFEITNGVLLDGWREIPDILDLIEVLVINSRGKNKTLNRIHSELHPVKYNPLMGMNIESVILDELSQGIAEEMDQQILKEYCLNDLQTWDATESQDIGNRD